MSEETIEPQEETQPTEGETQETESTTDEGDDSSTEEESKEEESKEEESKEEEEDDLTAVKDQEIQQLRQLLRESKRDIESFKTRLDNSDNTLKEAGLVTEEQEAEATQQKEAFTQRSSDLETILEVMRINPKYEDIDSVVSQVHFDDMVDMMATDFAKQQGIPQGEAVSSVEQWVWGMTNPYRYMYEQIKEHHPSFQKQEAAKAKQAPVTAPTSLQNIDGGAGSNAAGWSAEKIDNLPEDELSKVPSEVYTQYLRNELK